MAVSSEALADLRRARRRNRVVEIDWVDALYRAYLTGLAAIGATVGLVSLVGDGRLDADGVRRVADHGDALIGLVAAVAVGLAIRSGGRGGPLAVEAADVRHVLLAPVPRGAALRGPATHLLRFGTYSGTAFGAVVGLVVARRLPESTVAWIAAGAATGLLVALAALGAGLVVSGRRLRAPLATAIATAVIVWSIVDVRLDTASSPLTFLGRLALWPLDVDLTALIGVAVAVVLGVAGLALVGGLSLEAAERRASLVGQLRFAVTLQDLRTVMLLRRQLAQERPRRRPWLKLSRGGRAPVWRRGWRGVLRWPTLRVGRVAIMGAAAGLAMRGAWSGTTPLVVVAGLAIYVAALEAVEPLAQEVDHPDAAESVPFPAGALHLRHLAVGMVVTTVAGLVGIGAAVAVGPDRALAAGVGFAVLLPAAAAATVGAAASVLGATGAPAGGTLFPEAMGMALVLRTVWPLALAVVGTLPVLAARQAFREGTASPAGSAVAAGIAVLIVVGLGVAWVRFRIEAREWWDSALAGVTGGGKK